jgi:hypothetical protein
MLATAAADFLRALQHASFRLPIPPSHISAPSKWLMSPLKYGSSTLLELPRSLGARGVLYCESEAEQLCRALLFLCWGGITHFFFRLLNY